ncbi:MAG: hypothetical protein A3G87_06060 [Omnitrophica bacterium RIFCSPLOWO2_12_FULL_50_11]|nr:MAG: hypothetical protein A3G87_06060 [Omnitrophica bacterium RIFCSPLOWO2_12_FULL_50_11]
MTTEKVLVCIITYRRLHYLRTLLECLNQQRLKPYKIVIVDNGSQPEVKNLVSSYDRCAYVDPGDNIAQPAGLALVIEKYRNDDWDYLWILDDDMYFSETALEELVSWFRLIDQSKLGAIVPPISTHLENGEKKILFARAPQPRRVTFVNWAGLLCAKKVLDAGVRPDPALFFGWPDADFSLSIRRKGFSVMTVPGPEIFIPSSRDTLEGIGLNPDRGIVGKFLSWRKYRMRAMPPWRAYYYVRNTLLVGIRRHRLALVYFIRFLLTSFATLNRDQWRFAMLGLFHGLIGKDGKTVEPLGYDSESKAEESSFHGS